jgi:Ca2+-dependent lipid-binding protein
MNPVFDEGVQIDIHARHKSTLYLEVKDFNQFSSDVTLGVLTYPLSAINIATVTTVELPLEGASSGSIKFRYLFEEAILKQVKEENEMKLHTETSALGKLGKGLTSQVTGLGTMFGSVLSAPMKEKKLRKTFTGDHSSSSSFNNLANPRESAASNTDPLKAEPTVTEKTSNVKLAPTDLFKINTVENPLQKRDGTQSASSIAGSKTFSLQPSIDHNSAPIGGDFVEVQIWGAKDLKSADMGGTSDPFIRVTLQGFQNDNKRIHKTAVVKKTLNPVWENEKFVVPLNGTAIKLSILDKNLISNSTPLGHVVLDASTLLGSKSFVDEWYGIQSGEGRLRVSMKNISTASSEVSQQKSQKKQTK